MGVRLQRRERLRRGWFRLFRFFCLRHGNGGLLFNGLSFEVLGNQDAAYLEVLFSEEEVFTTLSDLNGDKAPGDAEDLKGFSLSVWWVVSSSCLLKKAKDGGFLPGWSVNGRCGDGVVIFHLLFVDDTIKREREENLDSHSYGVYIQ
ncbi:hypothetical protein CK203_003045 [Vitis vinifera]|uniref:Uncharacterized protein n=1 Tax=Vitis vinifera TaxID=29760 RepID=A0A438K7D5_VITVI|nr:hypothetical protein CK203_003045 [Vitis vinifera]